MGALNPPTVRRVEDEWVLVAGERRLAAMGQLGWTDTPVTVATSIEDELTALYAERDENTQREAFSPSEMVVHARRIEERERELAKQRQQDAGREHGRGQTGYAESAQPIEPAHQRTTRARVAKAVGTSHDTLSKARHVIDTAEDPATPPEVAEIAKRSAANLNDPFAVVDRDPGFLQICNFGELDRSTATKDPRCLCGDQRSCPGREVPSRDVDRWGLEPKLPATSGTF